MSGWAVAGYSVAVWIALSPPVGLALGRLIRHGENQAHEEQKARDRRHHAASWGRDNPTPTRKRSHRR